jgi:Na+-transporting methylmalonyl-CoA/oxaloacetate decarboxylase gamma subunit
VELFHFLLFVLFVLFVLLFFLFFFFTLLSQLTNKLNDQDEEMIAEKQKEVSNDIQKFYFNEIFAVATSGLFLESLVSFPYEDGSTQSQSMLSNEFLSTDDLHRILKLIEIFHHQMWFRFHNCRIGNGIFLRTVLPFLQHYSSQTTPQQHSILQVYFQFLHCLLKISFHDPAQYTFEEHHGEEIGNGDNQRANLLSSFCLASIAMKSEGNRYTKEALHFVNDV